MNKILHKRSVTFRDKNKDRWTVDFEVRESESKRIDRVTLEEFDEHFEISVCGEGGNCCGQCYEHIEPRTPGQKMLLEFWNTYHLNNMSGGTEKQDAYLSSQQFKDDYAKFVDVFSGYNKEYRERFDSTNRHIIDNLYNIGENTGMVTGVINQYMNGNPIQYILGIPQKRFDTPRDTRDLYVQFFFLAIRGLYVDRGYKYGENWLYSPIPENIIEKINSICNLIKKEEQELTESIDGVFNMGAEDFEATHETVDQVMELRDCDENEAKRFIALGMHLECTFGELNDTFLETDYSSQIYIANGIEYYLGTEDELTEIAENMIIYGEKMSVLRRQKIR